MLNLIKLEKLKKITILIASVALLYSCDKKNTETVAADVPKSDSAVVQNDSSNSSSRPQNLETPAALTASSVVSSSGKPALNPAHGQPYHRCEIAVGAPIDSAPTQQNATPQAAAPSILSPNVAPAASSPAPQAQSLGPKPATNPAHGQPHHRCELAVGAPLT